MLKINSLDVDAHVADPSHELWLYNCFDCAVTCETLPKIASQLDEHSTRAYHFSLAMLAPALDMMFRGMRVDRAKQDEFIYKFEKAREQYERQLLAILKLGVGVEPTYLGPKKAVKYLWNSNNRLKALLYGVMGLPEQQVYDKETKAMKVTVNRDALEALMEEHIDARPICSHILAIRDALGPEIETHGSAGTAVSVVPTTSQAPRSPAGPPPLTHSTRAPTSRTSPTPCGRCSLLTKERS